MTTVEDIKNIINNHLQEKVDFYLENKKIKSGKILLFSIKDFYCVFVLMSEEKKKRITFEIPYPFNIKEVDQDSILFDYTLQTFIDNNKFIKEDILFTKNKKTSKLLNKKLTLKFYI